MDKIILEIFSLLSSNKKEDIQKAFSLYEPSFKEQLLLKASGLEEKKRSNFQYEYIHIDLLGTVEHFWRGRFVNLPTRSVFELAEVIQDYCSRLSFQLPNHAHIKSRDPVLLWLISILIDGQFDLGFYLGADPNDLVNDHNYDHSHLAYLEWKYTYHFAKYHSIEDVFYFDLQGRLINLNDIEYENIDDGDYEGYSGFLSNGNPMNSDTWLFSFHTQKDQETFTNTNSNYKEGYKGDRIFCLIYLMTLGLNATKLPACRNCSLTQASLMESLLEVFPGISQQIEKQVRSIYG